MTMTHHGERPSTHEVMPDDLNRFLLKSQTSPIIGLLSIIYQLGIHEKAKHILELGTGHGIATTVLAEIAKANSGMLVTVDVLASSVTSVPKSPRVQFLNVASQSPQIGAALVQHGIIELDMLLIDADHHAEAISDDFYLWSPWVKQHGLILLHDVCLLDPECEGPVFWENRVFPGYEKLTLPWSNGLGILRKMTPPR